MRRHERPTPMLLASLVAALTLAPFRAPAGQVDVSPILDRMARAYHDLKTLEATLHQQKSYPQLGMQDPAESGIFYVKRKSSRNLLVRIEMREPERRIVTVKDNRYVFFQPAIRQAIEGTLDQNLRSGAAGTSFLAFFLGGLSEAGRDYNLVGLGDETMDGRKTAHLRLTPKTASRGLYLQVDLWVDQELWLPIQQQFLEPNQNTVLLKFKNFRINLPVPDRLFSIDLPPDVERVRG